MISATRIVDTGAPLRWLAAGWRDFLEVPAVSLAHGLLLVLAGVVIVALGYEHAALLAGAFSGFVLVAPALLVGLYSQSRAIENDDVTGVPLIVPCIRRTARRVMRVGLLLALAGSAWVLVSSMIVRTAAGGHDGVAGYLEFFAGKSHPWLFWLWLLAGAVGAALVFAATAVSLPMLVDREDIGIRDAVQTSIQAVGNNPVPMALWAGLIMLLVMAGMVTVIGLLLLVPILGHASWHAYRALVVGEADADFVPKQASATPGAS